MGEIRININGKEITAFDGETIAQIAEKNGIFIPTLCADSRVEHFGSCGICMVEVENSPRLMRSCSTYASNGMVIKTDTPRTYKARQTALELLLSDHTGDCRPPCVLACPAQTDCQGYVGLIANGENKESLRLITDKIPLPGAIGHVCPHPCEDACRREMVEEPISIAALKRFAADATYEAGDIPSPDIAPDTGQNIAVIGGGPGGLSAAYFLRLKGHGVTIYDAMPKMGGMLRYGIPEYRLPKDYLDFEIELIKRTGIEFVNNVKIGRDITLQHLRERFDSVIVAVGAWKSTDLGCAGEELDGVIGGIDFLRQVALGEKVYAGKKIAVVGGGNTAMDACRTAVRLGADAVYNVYRRTKNEMPAEAIEITEAGEEGVIFKNLTNPLEVMGANGKVTALKLQIMELGEPDASGRRAPVPVQGSEEILEVDTVIVAIGQKLDPIGLDGIDLTKWGTVSADETTFLTCADGVFAIGDATNKGADIAIAAIAEAKKAAEMIHKYLAGEKLGYKEPYLVKTYPEKEEFSDREVQPRVHASHRPAEERKNDFLPVTNGFTEEQAICEASRCLECGCHDYFECKLYQFANAYDVNPEKLDGAKHNRKVDTEHKFIHRNVDKCILCGLCVRICDEVVGASAMGLVDRGFETEIKTALDLPLGETGCISCGMCVSVCPTGALTETMMIDKQVPLAEESAQSVCTFCSVGCKTEVRHKGDMIIRALPCAEDNRDALLCVKGRFGFSEEQRLDEIALPALNRGGGDYEELSFRDAAVYTAKRIQAMVSGYGEDSVAFAVSDKLTNEQAAKVRALVTAAFGDGSLYCFNMTESALAEVLGRDASTADFKELENTQLAVIVNMDIRHPHTVAGFSLIKAHTKGAQVIALNGFESDVDDFADLVIDPGEDLHFLQSAYKYVLENSPVAKSFDGYAEALASLEGVTPDERAVEFAKLYMQAKKAVIMYEQNNVTKEAAALIAGIALAAGHAFAPRSGVIQLKPNANSQGIADLGVRPGSELLEKMSADIIKGLVVIGEDVSDNIFSGLEFLAVQDTVMTDTALRADIITPLESTRDISGSFTNTVGVEQHFGKVNAEAQEFGFVELLAEALNCKLMAVPARREQNVPKLPTSGDGAFRAPYCNTNAVFNAFVKYTEE